jgi:hypothetical protein
LRTIFFCSFPCTNTSAGKTPEPELWELWVIVPRAIACYEMRPGPFPNQKQRINCRSRLLCRLAPSQGILCPLCAEKHQDEDHNRQSEGSVERCFPSPERRIM